MSNEYGSRHYAGYGFWGFGGLLAYIGAACYFIGVSDGSFWGVVIGLLQALVWPAYLLYGLLDAYAVV